MKPGDTVVCIRSEHFPCGQSFVVNDVCAALGIVSLESYPGTYPIDAFLVDDPEARKNIRPGEWWVTRGLVLVLVNSRDEFGLLVSVPCGKNGCALDMYKLDGTYASSESEMDLLCKAPEGLSGVGFLLNDYQVGLSADTSGAGSWKRLIKT